MALPITDERISKQLILREDREDQTARAFRDALRKLNSLVDDPVSLDIGANIGYYVLMECSILSGERRLYAVEPHPQNIKYLKNNLEINGIGDVDVDQAAISDESGTAELFESPKSNRHQLGKPPHSGRAGQRIEVDKYTVDEYMDQKGISPSDVNVIRMDVEGHEAKIFRGMDRVLESNGPLIVFLEFHTWLLDLNEIEELIDRFEKYDIEILKSFEEAPHYEGVDLDYSSWSDFDRNSTTGPKLILTKGIDDI